MSDKMAWLTMIDRKARREKNLSVFLKCALLIVIYFMFQVFDLTIEGFAFAMCMSVLFFFMNVLVDQKGKEYGMLYEQASKTPANDITFQVEPMYNAVGRKAGKADFLSVCADWKRIAYYAFIFIINLALLIAVAVARP